MKPNLILAAALLAAGGALHAAPRTSANYSIVAEIADAGGLRATSANYTHDGSAGNVTGLSNGVPALAKHGYIGQLFEIIGFALNASPLTIDEAGTRQLGAWRTLDDATFLAVAPTSVTWSVLSGPLASVSADGLATAGLVFGDTPASVQGDLALASATLNLTVLDTIPDNFGDYAGDGIGDDWQVQFFGEGNPLAAPGADADGDGQDNRFEFLAGLVPTDPDSVFRLRIEAAAQGALLIFSPVVSGRTYTATFEHDLLTLPPWPALPGPPPTFDNGSERTVIDTDAIAVPQRFYRIEISKP